MNENEIEPGDLAVDEGLLYAIYEAIIMELQETELEEYIGGSDKATRACILSWLESYDIYDPADFIQNYDWLVKAAKEQWKPMQN